MKNNRILALILTLCMMFGLMQFPASATAPVFTATATSPTVYADALYTYAAVPDGIDDEGYTVYYTDIPAEITFAESEHYANSLTDYQKGIYRAAMDILCDIDSDALAVKQKVIIEYTTIEPASITTQEEFNTLVNNKLNEEAPKLDIQRLYNAIQYDHTELFWARNMTGSVGINASYDGVDATFYWSVTLAVDASENFDSDEALILAAKDMDSAVEMIISDAPTTGEYDLLVYFNDWLKANNTYNNTHLENDNYPLAHTAYSAFTSDNDEPTGPVCQGYAYALKYLCDLAGIKSVVVTGTLYQTYDDPGPHAWNAVELDGKWYAIDTTANDSLSTDVYSFLAGSATPSHDSGYPTFSASHVNDTTHTYPTLSETAYVAVVRLPGDVNGDDIVNNKDFGILRQYLNNWDVTINESNADVNADGIVNNKDMGILRQYLNNWDVELI